MPAEIGLSQQRQEKGNNKPSPKNSGALNCHDCVEFPELNDLSGRSKHCPVCCERKIADQQMYITLATIKFIWVEGMEVRERASII